MSSHSLTPAEQAAYYETRQPAVYAVCAVLLLLGNAAVPLRIWAQWRVHKKPLIEDYLLIAALICADVVTIATMIATSYGLGLHLWRVEAQDPSLQTMVKVFCCIWITALFNGPTLFATKVSLLLYYRRLFLVNQTWLKIAWWINLVYVMLWALYTTLFYILQCSPPSYYWERFDSKSTIQNGTCLSGNLGLIGLPLILSAVSDLAIMLLPILTVLHLKIPFARKIGLAAVFSIGFLSFGCAVARIVVLLTITEVSEDVTWSSAPFELLNAIELTFAIVCASAVPIFSRIRHILRGDKPSTGYATYGYQMQSTKNLKSSAISRLPSSSSEHLRQNDSELEGGRL